jgi:hypothetical protein
MPAPKAKGGRRLLVIILALVLIAGGGGVAYYLGFLDRFLPGSITGPDQGDPTPTDLPDQWPLTGVIGEVSSRPALAAKITNDPDLRPSDGLHEADIVFEYLNGSGTTEFLAIYHSNLPIQLAPIHTLSSIDGALAGWTSGLIAFSTGLPDFVQQTRSSGLQLLANNQGNDGFTEVTGWSSPQIAGDPKVLVSRADPNHQGLPPAFCAVDNRNDGSTAQNKGTMANNVMVIFGPDATPMWQWEAAFGKWLRFEGEAPALRYGGGQLSAVNVITIEVEVRDTGLTGPDGQPYKAAIVTGQGRGLVASGQMVAEITWIKESATAPWQFLDSTGEPLVLVPGSTWIELVPRGAGEWVVY